MQFNTQKAFTSIRVLTPILKREVSESAEIHIFNLSTLRINSTV